MPINQLDSVKNDFANYLTSLGLSPKSHKNYRCDLTHFTSWAILKIRSFGSYAESLEEIVPFINHEMALEYKKYLEENSTPFKTINRRLSTLRHLSKFLIHSRVTDLDFMTGIENISSKPQNKESLEPVVEAFRAHLEAEKVSDNTIKNYLSDIKQFISWLESNQPINQLSN